ncbi:hypothetical protein [Gordonia tangerina]|uniref:ABM domain-containing protein n=1 Tax=Gordonia tangerina TaxID=2911060 RepID=A0ABS9DCG4_9ACTN|nr:hypothetical protein [Gordonia tangerina]MCF3936905.1 hypothetical protein [Gordonia tangerina]
MFIQLFQGKVSDADGLQRCLDRWDTELKPGATGYLGTTAGITDDGTFVALARFESQEAAKRNSERPEQGTWWAETEQCFDGPVTFMDCTDVTEWMQGGSDDAGFVQIMESHSSDVGRMRELMGEVSDRVHEGRPDIIGGLLCGDGSDSYVEAIYFTSEAAAREGEKMEMPDDLRPLFEEEMRLMGDISYYDLHTPLLASR